MEWITFNGILSFLTGSMTGTALTLYFHARRQKTELTFKIIEQFFTRHTELGAVRGFLLDQEALEDRAILNRVLSLGDWFETIALMCREKIINPKLIKQLGIDDQIKGFLLACMDAGPQLDHAVTAWNEQREFVGLAKPMELKKGEVVEVANRKELDMKKGETDA